MSRESISEAFSLVAGTPESYLEVGCADGGSLLDALASFPSLMRVAVADTWGREYGGTGRGGHQHIERAVADLFPQVRVDFYDGDSHSTLSQVVDRFDLILVDGDHSDEGARRDLEDCWKLLGDGGALIFDDVAHPEHGYLREVFMEFSNSHTAHWLMIEDCGTGFGMATKEES